VLSLGIYYSTGGHLISLFVSLNKPLFSYLNDDIPFVLLHLWLKLLLLRTETLVHVISRIIVPKDFQMLISQSCAYVTLKITLQMRSNEEIWTGKVFKCVLHLNTM
jgi:hypothetical protein